MQVVQNFGSSLARDFKSQALLNKLPQIFTIFSEKSVQGLSFTSYSTEALSLTFTVTYSIKSTLPYIAYEEPLYNLVQSNLKIKNLSFNHLVIIHFI